MMAVDDIEIMHPNKRLAELLIPMSNPTMKPVKIIELTMTHAPIAAVLPTFISFLKLKSIPKLNRRKITPNSDQLLMSEVPEMSGVKEI